ncbi:Metallo-dependent phosphatase-like protein [Gongronella butleri]|nr:Metallo-dependent phosphatase-like protein [Gongronella butleri]
MKPTLWQWLLGLVTLICSLRACHLYWQSTRELRATSPSSSWWPVFHPQKKNPPLSPRTLANDDDPIILTDSPDRLFYFVQISDLHVSKYRTKGHTLHFLQFIQSILPRIKPEFVTVTGDLTDAKDHRRITSQQYLEEWQLYQQAIEQQPWTNTTWYDIRGNHDCFDLPSWQSRANLYRTHGQQAHQVEQGQGIYSWQHKPAYGDYNFVAIDACPKRGPSRPFNFFGYLTSSTMDRLVSAITAPANHTFVFSHYPTTTMVFGVSNDGYTFRDLAKHYSVYFCGHLHRLIAGIGDVLQSYDVSTKSLELELGDMKDHGMYRIVAVDHDMVSFVDAAIPGAPNKPAPGQPLIPLTADSQVMWPGKINDISPVILITNPKEARFAMDAKEPLWRMQTSTHIRFLVFADSPPDQLVMDAWIDGQQINATAQFVGNDKLPLWTIPWTPANYGRGPHQLIIRATTRDSPARPGQSSIVFRTDGQRTKIGGGPGEWIIASDMSTVFQFMTLLTIAVVLGVLIVPQWFQGRETSRRLLLRLHNLDQAAPSVTGRWQRHILVWTLRCIHLPSSMASVWYGSFVFMLALVSLPWFRAEFIPSGESPAERFGTFYLYGMVFGNEWVPLADTWMFAAEQAIFNIAAFFYIFMVYSLPMDWLQCRGHALLTLKPSANDNDDNEPMQKAPLASNMRRGSSSLHWLWSPYARAGIFVYWLWRTSELVALASFYGGVWPTLSQNILVIWLLFVGSLLGLLLLGGPSHPDNLQWLVEPLLGCDGCKKASHLRHPLNGSQNSLLAKTWALTATENTISDHHDPAHTDAMIVDLLTPSCSSGSASSTPFSASPRTKNRKRMSPPSAAAMSRLTPPV